MPIELKKCAECGGGPWPPSRFYKVGKRKDGTYRRNRRCKDCIRKAVRENQELKAESVKKYKAEWAKRPHVKASRAAYMKTPRGKEVMRESRRAWEVTHPEHYRAIVKRSNEARNKRRREERAAIRAARQSPPQRLDNDAYTNSSRQHTQLKADTHYQGGE